MIRCIRRSLLVIACSIGLAGPACADQMVPQGPPSPYSTIGWSFGSIAANLTDYTGVGAPGGTNQNSETIVSFSGSLSALYVKTGGAAGAGQSYTFTLYAGTPGGMTATSITCVISGASATTCSDLSHTAPIAAGQAFALQVVTSASAAATGVSTASIGAHFSQGQ